MLKNPRSRRKVLFAAPSGKPSTPEIDAVVLEVISLVADKWTMSVLEVLEQNGTLRFTHVAKRVSGISQRMLTKTLRQLEDHRLVTRRVHAEVPPKVEYTLTALGSSLCAAFCSVWSWAEEHSADFESLRKSRPQD